MSLAEHVPSGSVIVYFVVVEAVGHIILKLLFWR